MLDFSQARVTVVGDAMVDRYVHGRMERISAEAPVPVFEEESVEVREGGAANVLANLVSLGVSARLFYGPRKAIKTRYMVNGQQTFRVDEEITNGLSWREQADLGAEVTAEKPDVLVLSDYGKGVFTAAFARSLIEWARRSHVPVVVDPKGPWERYRGATIVKPNAKEMGQANPAWLMTVHQFDAVLVSKGEKGATLHTAGRERFDYPARAEQVVDVCGAGDTMVAALAASMAIGKSLQEAAHIANIASGVVVGKAGTATCSIGELRHGLALHPYRQSEVRAWGT